MNSPEHEDVDGLRDRNAALEREVERLSAEGALNRQIVARIREGIGVADAEHRWTFTNRRFEEMLGYGPGELLGQHMFTLLTPEGRARAEASDARRREGVVEHGEARIVRRDGQEIWVKFETNSTLDAGGTHAGVITVILDISERRAAEERLHRSEDQLREAQALSHIGSWELDLRTDVITRSAELLRIFGVTESERAPARGLAVDLIHVDDRERARSVVEAAIAKRENYAIDVQLNQPGEARFLHIRGRVACDADGTPVRLLGTMQDVTERKRVEDALRRSEEQLREAQTVMRIGSWELDLATNVMVRSDELNRMYGVTAEDLAGRAGLIYDFVHPGDRDRVRDALDACVASRAPCSVEFRLARPGPSQFLHTRARIVCAEDGTALRMLGTVQDVTERKREEEVVRRREEQLREAQAIAHVGSWELDLQTGTMLRSEELLRIYGVTEGELAENEGVIYETIHPSDRERVRAMVAAALANRAPGAAEYRLARAGEVQFVHARARVVYAEDGTPLRMQGTLQDVTERKQAEEQLRKAQELASIGTWELDLSTGIATRSPQLCRMFGESAATHVKGADAAFAHVHPDDRQRVRAEMQEAIAQRDGYAISTTAAKFVRFRGSRPRELVGRS
jgi:PAS domain S-box-containing protein